MTARTSRQKQVARALGVAFLAIGGGVAVTTPAWAQQSVIVVGGALTVLGQPATAIPRWTLVGDGISVVANGGDTGNPGGNACDPCVPGNSIPMSGSFIGRTLGSGSAVVNGLLYPQVFFAGTLGFQANTTVMPDFDGNSWRNDTVPFSLDTISGLQGYADPMQTQLLFSIQPLTGRGTATLQVRQNLGPPFSFYQFSSITYTFGPGVNLLEKPGFEEYTPPALGVPGWVSDPNRQTPAKSESNQPHSGSNNGACFTPESLDCGIYQEVTAPSTGTYLLTFYATADRDGGLVGAHVNGVQAVSIPVEARGFRNYGGAYTMTFPATAGDIIRVWMFSPAIPGYVVVDDVSLIGPQ